MRNLFYSCLFGLMLFMSKAVQAQDDTLFNQYVNRTYKSFFSIKGEMPEGFTVLRAIDPFKIPFWKHRDAEEQAKGFYDFYFLQSVDKECLLLYPIMPFPNFATNPIFPYNRITRSLTKSLGISWPADSVFVFDDYVTTITGKHVRELFNADSIHFYNIPLEEPFEEDYIYCTGMVVTKADRASLYFKWYFTEEGKKKERDYLQQLNGSLWFEEEWRLQKETEQARDKEQSRPD